MHDISWLEWFGYLASVVVAISLLMGTIVKLRTYNLIGASLFSLYGFLIGALPVAFLNGFIALINIYYLVRIYHRKEYFRVIPLTQPSPYLVAFIDFYKAEIQQFFPNFVSLPADAQINYAVLRNMAVAAVVVGREIEKGTAEIVIDFAVPEYRDLKPGLHIFKHDTSFFTNRGISKLVCTSYSLEHAKYLKRIGFTEEVVNGMTIYYKNLK
jgi:hypothetical protein